MATIEFLNIDMDLESKDDLIPLIEELGEKVVVMNYEKGCVNKVSLELSGVFGSPDCVVLEYAKIVESLSAKAKSLWEGCSKREIDVGFECEGEANGAPVGFTERLSLDSIEKLLRLRITMAITIYSVPV